MLRQIELRGNASDPHFEKNNFLASPIRSAGREFAGALAEALAHETAALIEIRIDPEAITTRGKLSAIRDKALQQQKKG